MAYVGSRFGFISVTYLSFGIELDGKIDGEDIAVDYSRRWRLDLSRVKLEELG